MNALRFAVEALILMKIGNEGEPEEVGSHLVALRHNDYSSEEPGVKTSNFFFSLDVGLRAREERAELGSLGCNRCNVSSSLVASLLAQVLVEDDL
jgi:hypothetical protein